MTWLMPDWKDIKIVKTEPATVHDVYRMKMIHIPTGLGVSDAGPSPYQLKMSLYERLSKLVLDKESREDSDNEQDT